MLIALRARYVRCSATTRSSETRCNALSAYLAMYEYSAEHSLAAVWTMVSSTGCNWVGDRLITLRTSPVAVWYSSASLSSRVRLQFVEQTHVFDRNHRLVGKGRGQLDLLVGEGLRGAPRDHKDADSPCVAQKGNTQDGAESAQLLCFGRGVFRVR